MTQSTINLQTADIQVKQAAYWLKQLGLDSAYLTRVTNGVPVNYVRNEALRQVANIVVPCLVGLGSFMLGGAHSLYLGLPVAFGLFMAMDAQLAWAQRGLVQVDEGRAELVTVIANGLKIEAGALTKNMVMELASHYVTWTHELKAQEDAKLDSARREMAFMEAVKADTARMRSERLAGRKARIDKNIFPDGIDHWLVPQASRVRSYAAGSMAAMADADGVIPDSALPMVNINGAPMVGNTGMDINGNVYGVTNNGF